MSNLQTRLAIKNAKLKRKLYDNNINNVGYNHKLLILQIEENRYQDEVITLLSSRTITGHIAFPNNKVPIFQTDGYNHGTSIFDLLPIKLYCKFEDAVNKGDIIILKYLLNPDDNTNKVLVFKVVEELGSFSTTLLSKEYNIAPHVLDIDAVPEIKAIIENWEEEAF